MSNTTMTPVLVVLLFFPIFVFLVLKLGSFQETTTHFIMRMLVISQTVAVGFLLYHRWHTGVRLEEELFAWQLTEDHSFRLLLFVDNLAFEFLILSTALLGMITRFSRTYLHREPGFQRFFAVLALFLAGLNWVSLSGTFDLLFLGWEMVGIASFMLIGFYSHREQTVKNALEVYSIYRFCDVGFLLSALFSVYLFHHTQGFSEFRTTFFPESMEQLHPLAVWGLSIALILAAMGKSGQFPFSFWLSRAMEGPTPSSALFYGALSIHLGVFLLLRTEAIWGHSFATRALVFVIGGVTLFLAVGIGRLQSSMKGQIAYASVAQVGLMFMEVACGWRVLAEFHMAANACLRSYQILISPSSVAYFLKVQSSSQRPSARDHGSLESRLPSRLRSTWVVFAMREAYLPDFVRMFSSGFFRFPRSILKRWGNSGTLVAVVILAIISILAPSESFAVAVFLALLVLLNTVCALHVKGRNLTVWFWIGALTLAPAAFMAIRLPESRAGALWFAAGIIPFWLLGVWEIVFSYSRKHEWIRLRRSLLWIAVLGTIGFPIGPAFLGEDMLMHVAVEHHPFFGVALCLSFVWCGFTAIRWLMYQPNSRVEYALNR